MRQNMSTIVIAERALLREGLVFLLQHTPYKVIAAAARASELKGVRVPPGRRTLALLQIEGAHSNVEEVSESIELLRSLFSDCRVVVIAEGSDPIDIQRIMTVAPDGYILNLGSGDILVKLLELTLMDQQVFVLGHRTPPPGSAAAVDNRKRVDLRLGLATSCCQSSSDPLPTTNAPRCASVSGSK